MTRLRGAVCRGHLQLWLATLVLGGALPLCVAATDGDGSGDLLEADVTTTTTPATPTTTQAATAQPDPFGVTTTANAKATRAACPNPADNFVAQGNGRVIRKLRQPVPTARTRAECESWCSHNATGCASYAFAASGSAGKQCETSTEPEAAVEFGGDHQFFARATSCKGNGQSTQAAAPTTTHGTRTSQVIYRVRSSVRTSAHTSLGLCARACMPLAPRRHKAHRRPKRAHAHSRAATSA